MRKTKKKKSTKKNRNFSKYIIYFLIIIILSLIAFIIGTVYTQKEYEKKIQNTQNELKILKQKIEKLKSQDKTHLLPEYYTNIPSEIADYKKSIILPPKEEQNITENKTTPLKHTAQKIKKPKLVIIIDDVSFKWQVNKIKTIPCKVTPSFFPPSKRHPNTPIYAKTFPHYMIHLPLEAIHFDKPEPNTLNSKDSYQTILKRIEYVKNLFPKAKFINNHTGSTFTSNKEAMIKLFRALKNENLGFVDSKTTPYSKSKEATQIYNIPLFSRDIFLDNKADPKYIQNQLKKAIKIAKKRGYAIAIGHPHPATLITLKNSKELLKDVEVVYIDELLNDK